MKFIKSYSHTSNLRIRPTTQRWGTCTGNVSEGFMHIKLGRTSNALQSQNPTSHRRDHDKKWHSFKRTIDMPSHTRSSFETDTIVVGKKHQRMFRRGINSTVIRQYSFILGDTFGTALITPWPCHGAKDAGPKVLPIRLIRLHPPASSSE